MTAVTGAPAITALTTAALVIIVTQGLIFVLLLACVRSFGAFTTALIRTHDENVLVHQHNINLTEQQEQMTRRLQRTTDWMSGKIPPHDQERTA